MSYCSDKLKFAILASNELGSNKLKFVTLGSHELGSTKLKIVFDHDPSNFTEEAPLQ